MRCRALHGVPFTIKENIDVVRTLLRHHCGRSRQCSFATKRSGTGRTPMPGTARVGLAFPRRRFLLPCRARFGSEGSARWRVDALVAIVPTDAILRRRVAAQHFLNDTSAGSAAR
jgi:hypothetical protein